MKMRDLLSIPRVIPRLRARDKQDALRKLAARAAGDAGVSVAAIVRSLLECAELPAIGLGAGVSLAHTFVPGLGGEQATMRCSARTRACVCARESLKSGGSRAR